MVETLKTDAKTAPKICIRPGCGNPLGRLNRSSRCSKHFHWQRPRKDLSAGNGHATARSNGTGGHLETPVDGIGSKPVSRGAKAESETKSLEVISDLADGFIEERLDRLILSFPIADKAKIATAWLKGEL